MPSENKDISIDSREVEKYLQKTEDELYNLLVPENLKRQLHFEGDETAFGRYLFVKKGRDVHKIVCQKYQCRKNDFKDMIELGIFVVSTLNSLPQIHGINVLAMAALIVKIGIDRWCRKEE